MALCLDGGRTNSLSTVVTGAKWGRVHQVTKLLTLARVLSATCASEAYCERIFSRKKSTQAKDYTQRKTIRKRKKASGTLPATPRREWFALLIRRWNRLSPPRYDLAHPSSPWTRGVTALRLFMTCLSKTGPPLNKTLRCDGESPNFFFNRCALV